MREPGRNAENISSINTVSAIPQPSIRASNTACVPNSIKQAAWVSGRARGAITARTAVSIGPDPLPWAVYAVRRTLSPRTGGKVNHARSVRILDIGDPAAMRARLDQRARLAGVPVTVGDMRFPDDTHPRAWLRHREPLPLADGKTTAAQFLTIAPVTAINKTGPAFPNAWAAAAQFHMF